MEIDINCDVGEGVDNEHLLMPYISSCNIACGGHFGDKNTIDKTIELAVQNKVLIGAHPSFPDKENFGRKLIEMADDDFKESIQNQLNLFRNVHHHLSDNGYFLFQYPQAQLKQKNNLKLLNYWIDEKKYLVREKFYPKINPVIFLPDKQINNLIKLNNKKFKLLSSSFDIGTFSKHDSSLLTINRFLLLKKK